MKLSITIIILLIVICIKVSAYVSIKTVAGDIYRGVIINETKDTIKIQAFNGVIRDFFKGDISFRKEIRSIITTTDNKDYEG